MEAAVSARKLDGEKAQRIVAAMRESVGARGAAGSTFDHVARAAGVSRGLLHYYFGSKERLLVEVVRTDCELRLQVLEERLADAHTVEDVVTALERGLADYLDPAANALVFEMFSVARTNEEIREELAELYRRIRERVAEVLREKNDEGEIRLPGEPEAVAAVLFALGDGITLQVMSAPGWDSRPAIEVGARTVRLLLGGDA